MRITYYEFPEGTPEETLFEHGCDEEDRTVTCSVTWAKKLMRRFGGIAYTHHCERDGSLFEVTEITLKGNNSRFNTIAIYKEEEMRVKDYLQKIGGTTDVTFIKARAREDASAPGYHAEYQTTPIRMASEWLDPKWNNERLLDSIILNDKQPPIEWISGAKWSNDFNSGYLRSLLVVSEADLELLEPWKPQRDSLEKYIEDRLTTLL